MLCLDGSQCRHCVEPAECSMRKGRGLVVGARVVRVGYDDPAEYTIERDTSGNLVSTNELRIVN